MRYRWIGAVFAVVLLACSFIWLHPTGKKSSVVKAQAAPSVPDSAVSRGTSTPIEAILIS